MALAMAAPKDNRTRKQDRNEDKTMNCDPLEKAAHPTWSRFNEANWALMQTKRKTRPTPVRNDHGEVGCFWTKARKSSILADSLILSCFQPV